MELGWTALGALILAAAVVWFWQNSLAARERANEAAMEACSRLSLQFLDGTVAFSRLQLVRGTDSLFTMRRTYVFDYTANSIERRQGFVVLTGRRVETVGFARAEVDAPQPQASAERAIEVKQLPPTAKVLSLDEWRARQRSATGKASETRYNGTHAGD
ncbi:MAG TPA: DUF3301 domain-containing protein [Steroidobacteraceae bacterium]